MIIFHVDDHKRRYFLHCASCKCKRVNGSLLAGEDYLFFQGYDYGISITMMFKLLKVDVLLYIFTDSKRVFDTITASKHLREFCSKNDIADIRHAYLLTNAMQSGRLDFVIEQWIFKEK